MMQQFYFKQFILAQVICLHLVWVVKHFYLTYRLDSITYYHSGLEWSWEQRQWSGTQHSPNLLGWSLTIRLFYVISRRLVGGGGESYPFSEMQSVYSTASADWAVYRWTCTFWKNENCVVEINSHIIHPYHYP